MFPYLSRRGTRSRTTTRLRRITAALAAVTGGLLAWVVAVPAASAATILIPDPGGASGLDQAVAEGQAGQVGAAAAAGLVPDPVQVGADGADGDVQLRGDLGVGVALGD